MSKTVSKLALTASLVLAMALTFSCSGDDGGGEEKFSYCIKDGFCHEGPYTLESCSSWGIPSNNCPNGGGGGSSSSVGGQGGGYSSSGGGSPSSSSGGTQGGINLSYLPKQVYLMEYDDTVLVKKEPFNGNGDIFVRFWCDNYDELALAGGVGGLQCDDEAYSDGKEKYYLLPAGKIQNGQLSLNLPAILDSKYLSDMVPCRDNRFSETCESTLSGVPKNLAFVTIYSLNATISDRSESDCSLEARNPYLINSGETGGAELSYFSESGRITGTERDGCRQHIWDINFSKGWNLVSTNYNDPDDCDDRDNYMALTTDLSKGGTWEWWLECYDRDELWH